MIRDAITDRFIPIRMQQCETLSADKFDDLNTNYSKIISPEKFRCLKFSCKSAEKKESVVEFIHKSIKKRKSNPISRSVKAYKILDAPEVINNFYHSPLDWGPNNIVGIALNYSAYLVKPSNQIIEVERYSLIPVTSLKMICESSMVLFGEETGRIQVFDVENNIRIRNVNTHYNRVGCLCSKESGLFFSGSKDKLIKFNDLRLKKSDVLTFQKHRGQVCGMAINCNYLASGGNQNKVIIWDIRNSKAILQLKQHKSAIKALSWCPWKSNVLATGGGYKDGKIIIWNGNTQKIQKSLNLQSQISSLSWNEKHRCLVSTASNSKHSCSYILEQKQMRIKLKLKGHIGRIIGMSINPQNQDQLCSIGSDETLRF